MLKIKRIDHVAVCVRDVDEAALPWRTFLGSTGAMVREVVASPGVDALLLPGAAAAGLAGIAPQGNEGGAAQGVDALLLPVDADACIELIAPKGNEGLEKFLAKRGPGLHHIAFEVEAIEEAIAAVRALGMDMIDEVPRIGARGHKVAFVHPSAFGSAFGGVLVELVERACP